MTRSGSPRRLLVPGRALQHQRLRDSTFDQRNRNGHFRDILETAHQFFAGRGFAP